jgi:hypothetical protein
VWASWGRALIRLGKYEEAKAMLHRCFQSDTSASDSDDVAISIDEVEVICFTLLYFVFLVWSFLRLVSCLNIILFFYLWGESQVIQLIESGPPTPQDILEPLKAQLPLSLDISEPYQNSVDVEKVHPFVEQCHASLQKVRVKIT